MAPSIQRDLNGPDWPLGPAIVTSPGTPINICLNVDPTLAGSPSSATASTQPGLGEYPARCNQIVFQAYKIGAAHGTQRNVGNVYVVRQGCSDGAGGVGSGNRDDTGSIVATLEPGQTFVLAPSGTETYLFSPYRYSIDADNANDGAFCTLIF